MERRAHARRPAGTRVYVCLPGQPARGCVARDLSKSGVFIETGTLLLRENAFVQLCFVSRRTAVITKIYRLPATVVRVSRKGAGLSFGRKAYGVYPPMPSGWVT